MEKKFFSTKLQSHIIQKTLNIFWNSLRIMLTDTAWT